MTRRNSPDGLVARPGWFAVLVVTMGLALMISGCTCGPDEVETDPTMTGDDVGMDDTIEDVNLPDDNLAGDGLGDGDVDASDVNDPSPVIVLQDVFFDFDSSKSRTHSILK